MVVFLPLILAYVIPAAPSEGSRVLCGNNSETRLYIDAGQEPMDVYGLENETLALFPSKDMVKGVPAWNVSWYLKDLTKYMKEVYKKLLVTFNNNEVNTMQVRYSIRKSEKTYRSKRITLYVGKLPIISLPNITSTTLNMFENDTVTFCFTLSGSPQPHISLFHSLGEDMTVVNKTRYMTKGDCLIVRMVRQQDTGTWTIKATNCFGSSNLSFSLNVSSHPNLPKD
jgi:hypothetical protein